MTWKGKSKGHPLGYRIFFFTIRVLGLGFAYFLLGFVTPYYVLFAKGPKKNLRAFYSAVPTIPPNKINKIVRRNFKMLGHVLIDKYAYLMGKGDKISYTEDGEQHLRKFVEEKKPLVLISAHIGNWEIAANLLDKLDARVNAVMYDGESEQLKAVLKEEVGDVHFSIIPIKQDISHIIKISQALKNGEFICIHGDRYLEGAKTIETSFFGHKFLVPYGPFQIAARLKAHHCFIFTIKNGKYNYHFTSTEPEYCDSPEEVAQRYVNALEEQVKKNPEQWFNYHPIFED